MPIILKIPFTNRLTMIIRNLITPRNSRCVELGNSVSTGIEEEVLSLTWAGVGVAVVEVLRLCHCFCPLLSGVGEVGVPC